MAVLARATRVAGDQTPRPARERMLARKLLRRAYHYLQLADRHPEEERFWLCRAAYYGRLSGQGRAR
jgi:hypothetical protein